MMASCARGFRCLALLIGVCAVAPLSPARADDAPPATAPTAANVSDTEPPPAPLTLTPTQAAPGPEDADSGAFGTVEEQAQQHVAKARACFTAGRYDDAIVELQAAYRLKPNPNYLFSIGQSHRRARRNRDALASYRRFLEESPNTPLKTETTNYISELSILVQQEDAIEKEKRRPLWKKSWFWSTVAASTAAAGLALGIGLGVGLRETSDTLTYSWNRGTSASAITRER